MIPSSSISRILYVGLDQISLQNSVLNTSLFFFYFLFFLTLEEDFNFLKYRTRAFIGPFEIPESQTFHFFIFIFIFLETTMTKPRFVR